MATGHSAPVRGWAADRSDGLVLWRAGIVLAVLLVGAYVVMPGRLVVLREVVLYPLIELLAAGAIVLGTRLYRPAGPAAWLLIAAGIVMFAVGDVVWGVYEAADRDPFPSVADVFYLGGYPLLGAGLVVAIRRRSADIRGLIDAGIVGVIAGLVWWMYFAYPARDDADLSTSETLITAAYPLADVALVTLALRLAFGSGWAALSLRLLVGGLLLMVVADVAYASDVFARVSDSRFTDLALLASIVLIGLAGLHPSMPALTERPATRRSPSRLRVVVLAAAGAVPAALLAFQALRDEPLHLVAVVIAMVLLSALVLARLVELTNTAARAAAREAALSRYAGELLRVSGREQLFAVATDTAGALVGEGEARLVDHATGPHEFAAPVTVQDKVIAELVVDATPSRLRQVDDSLRTVAAELSLALERERLLAQEQEAAAALAEQNARLRELDQLKDEFVSTVSHELRTPLTAMVGYLELILEGEAGDLNEQQQRFLEIVNRNSHRLNHLIGDVLFVSRVDQGRLSLSLEPVQLGELVQQAVESARAVADRSGVSLRVVAKRDLPPVHADASRVTQLLDNLISNAIKFTPSGGSVTVRVEKHGDSACLEVADTGVGIPADEVPHLFDRFFRASTGRSAPGTGLGLPIVQSIAEAHGGSVAVDSRVGVGTTFVVALPLEGADVARPAAAGKEASP